MFTFNLIEVGYVTEFIIDSHINNLIIDMCMFAFALISQRFGDQRFAMFQRGYSLILINLSIE